MIRAPINLRGLTYQLRSPFSIYPLNGKPPKMKPFNPLDHGLSADFILTNFTKMKG